MIGMPLVINVGGRRRFLIRFLPVGSIFLMGLNASREPGCRWVTSCFEAAVRGGMVNVFINYICRLF